MKKKLIIAVILFIILVAGIVTAVYFISLKTVNVTVNGDGYSVSILNEKGSQITSLPKSGSVRLEKGEYSYVVVGDDYDATPKAFSVGSTDVTLSITPTFSSKHLSDLLQQEATSINTLLHSNYDSKTAFTIGSVSLYEKGDWAAGTMTPPAARGQLADIYRFVLHKDLSGAWNIIVPPTIAIDKTAYPNVPKDILYSLYSSTN